MTLLALMHASLSYYIPNYVLSFILLGNSVATIFTWGDIGALL